LLSDIKSNRRTQITNLYGNMAIKKIIFINYFFTFLLLSIRVFGDTSAQKYSLKDTVIINKFTDTAFLNHFPLDITLDSLQNAIVLAKQLGNKKYLAKIFYARGKVFLKTSSFENALINFHWASDVYLKTGDTKNYFKSLVHIGYCYFYLNNLDSLWIFADKGLSLAKRVHDSLFIGRFINEKGLYYEMKGNTAIAIKYYLEALNVFQKYGNELGIARECINVGIIYQKREDTVNARSYFLKAYKIGQKLGDTDIISVTVNNLGDLYLQQKKYDLALIYEKRSLEIDKSRGNIHGISSSFNNIGNIYRFLGNLQKALKNYRKGLQIADSSNFLALKALCLFNIGQVYFDDTLAFYLLDTAIFYFQKSLDISRKTNNTNYILSNLNSLQDIYAKKKNYKTAYRLLEEYKSLYDSIYTKEKNKQFLEIQLKYETEQHKKETIFVRQKAEKTKSISIIISLSLFIIIIALVFILRLKYLNSLKLKQRQLFVDALLENSASHVLILNSNLHITYISSSILRVYSFQFDTKKPETLFDKVHPEDMLKLRQILNDLKLRRLNSANFECRLIDDKEENRYIRGVITNKLDEVNLKGIIINFWDITTRKNYVLALEQSEEKFRHIFEAFPDIFFRENIDGIITEVSPSVTKIAGYKPEEIIGKSATTFYYNPNEHRAIRKKIFATGELTDETLTAINIKGRPVICSLGAKLVFDKNGKVIAVEGVLRDITIRVQQERQLQEANDTKDKLFSIIAHDLVGPIGMQKNIIDLILSDIDSMPKEEIVPFLTSMKPALDATFFMIENLLSWARIMRNSIKANIKRNNFFYLVDQVFVFLQVQAKEKNIKLEYNGDKNVFAMFDNNLIDIVIRNLITNAIKFSNENSTIAVIVETKDEKAKISIVDKGIGIPLDIINNLINSEQKGFSRLGTKNEKGTGLGMIVVREFILKNNSRLNIESTVGKGSVFSFELPLAKE